MNSKHYFGSAPAEAVALLLVVWVCAIWAVYALSPFGVLAGIVLTVAVLVRLWLQRVTVSDDAVTVRGLLLPRHIPLGDIGRARRKTDVVAMQQRGFVEKQLRTTERLELTLPGGEQVTVETSDATTIASDILSRQRSLATRQRNSPPSVVARGGRSTLEWIENVRELAANQKQSSYRDAPRSHEALWNIVESRWQTQTSRAAAAIALALSPDPNARVRLKRIALRIEGERLRIAIDLAAKHGSEEELARTLEHLETLD